MSRYSQGAGAPNLWSQSGLKYAVSVAPHCSTADTVPTEFAYEVLAYQRYLAEADAMRQGAESYLMYEPTIRFMPEADDVLVPLPGLRVATHGRTASVIQHPATNTSIVLPTIEHEKATLILSALDGTSTLLGIQLITRSSAAELDAFLRATFGKLVFAPRALDQLERRISGTELVRFVGSPYEIRRNYWSNMADCRERILSRLCNESALDDWLRELRQLHIMALMGASARSYYRPQSPLGGRDARPGAFYTTPTRSIRHAEVTLLLDGPRVSAPQIGGRTYHALLSASLEDHDATLPDRVLIDDVGTHWGSLCLGFARNDAAPAPWFCPPRPVTSSHWEHLWVAFSTSLRAKSAHDALISLADFHWHFIRLHPFRCANQSLGMNVVNAMLLRHEVSGIPHFLLDQCCLRFSRKAYRTLFCRAVRQLGMAAGSTLERWRSLGELRARVDRFVGRIGDCSREQEAIDLVAREPDNARAALLRD